MILENFSIKWFTIYYTATGFLLIGSGIYLNLKKQQANKFLQDAAKREKPPGLFIKVVRYFLLFTLPGLILSFFPFSWIELLFTLWSLLLVYLAGIQLVRWDQNRKLIKANTENLPEFIGKFGAMMVAVGFAMFLIAYLVIAF